MQFQFRESEVSFLFVLLVVFFVSDEGKLSHAFGFYISSCNTISCSD